MPIYKESFEAYQAREGINFSTLKWAEVSASQLRLRPLLGGVDKTAFKVGRAIHCALLEPERYASDYQVIGSRATKAGKEQAANAEFSGVETLTHAEASMVGGMAKAACLDMQASYLLRSEASSTESTLTWFDEKTGTACKAREDLYNNRVLVQLDVKSFRDDIDMRAISGTILTNWYHCQLAFYRRARIANGFSVEKSLQLFCSKVAPYSCELIEIGAELMAHADIKLDEWLALSASADPTSITVLHTPNWYKDKYLGDDNGSATGTEWNATNISSAWAGE